MVPTHIEIAQTVIETSYRLRHHSLAGTAAFRRDMDQSRKAIKASRELLKRLRGRDRALDWEGADPAPVVISAFDADILRSAFRELVRETNLPECQWRDIAASLVYEYTGCERVEACLVDWMTGK
ncbi:MAG: hypothetical protein E5Y12_18180 [Mesorhizobium sp.]|nr:MAG: hypothetical protein E5Y12_18180 [Mesorhizobium sp.]